MHAEMPLVRTGRVLALAFGSMLLGSAYAGASTITYNVDQTIGPFGSVVGTIETDGAIGALSGTDITAFDLTLTGAGGATFVLTQNNAVVVFFGNDVSADANNLYFNFSGSDGGLLGFQQGAVVFSGDQYYCNGTPGNFACFQGASVAPVSVFDGSFQQEAREGVQIIGSATPLPAALPLFASGLGAMGFIGWRRKRKAIAV